MRFPAAVAAALVLAALPAPAQAAGCVWTPSGLAAHPSLQHQRVTGISPDGAITIGDATTLDAHHSLRGVLWYGSAAVDMTGQDFGPSVDNGPSDVNNSGVVVGYAYDNDTGLTRSYRFHDGNYEWLQAPDGYNAMANFVNERGDVAGWIEDVDGDINKTVLWRAGATQPEVIGTGQPVGLDEAGHVVTSGGQIWSPGGTIVQIKDLRGAKPRSYTEGHAVGVNYDQHKIIEWNLDGKVTRVITNASTVEAVSASGLIAGLHDAGGHRSWAIWTGEEPQDIDGYIVGFTDSGVAYGQRGWEAAIYTCR